MDNAKLVYKFQKNKFDQVRFAIKEYEGKEYIDLRLFYRDREGEYQPTKKGVMIASNLLPEMIKGIGELRKVVGAPGNRVRGCESH